ncbi:MAG: metallophosphoesterase [Pseudomonadota bacterium]
MRLALIADTHLSARSPECVANWHAARRAVGRLSPELTVNLGDITLDGQAHPEELEFAVQLVRQWSTPMLCVPGNHDVGDASGEMPLQTSLLAAYIDLFGPDHWARRAGTWLLLGVNAQLMGSGNTQEQAQWRWIEEQAECAGPQTQTVLFLHRPVLRSAPGEGARKGRYVTGAACERLLKGPLRRSLRVVVSGHTHQYLDVTADGVRHVWMPSSGFILADHVQPRVGEKVVGVGILDLDADGAGFDLWCPDGMLRHELANLQAFQQMSPGPTTGGMV